MENAVVEFSDYKLSEAISQHELVFVDFWAPWCGPCLRLGPIIEELAFLYAGRILIGKLNIEDHAEMVTKYAIRTIPTMLIIRKGIEVERMVGSLPIETIQKILNNYLIKQVDIIEG
ncbi:MAG: thioredoxin domain-containing protein [Candidatus Cardinium sp.]|nr:thioredoxin domain-containing protein [Candidatus Cardinium sp.]